jgi:hypothetical protein
MKLSFFKRDTVSTLLLFNSWVCSAFTWDTFSTRLLFNPWYCSTFRRLHSSVCSSLSIRWFFFQGCTWSCLLLLDTWYCSTFRGEGILIILIFLLRD